MTDAHCHIPHPDVPRQFVIGADFAGVHPWETLAETFDLDAALSDLESRLAADARLGVGEIGLDRLREKEIPAVMREAFAAQLELAAGFRRCVVLHGAKCWGQVVDGCRRHAGSIPAFLFHGFSRSDGLLGDIAALNGFISVGPALLNDHAVNYRALAKDLPPNRILIETDMDYSLPETDADETLRQIASTLAALRGESDPSALAARLADNARTFLQPLSGR